jgi:glycosyltransferase involved in cell wall biosynthesis
LRKEEQIKISVLMPVYNGENHLEKAVKSILNQSYGNFELIILLEYGSSIESKRIIYSFTDERIRVIENKERLGLPESLNIGIRSARGQYIARMDADDIAYPSRFKRQILFLESHADISIVGSLCKINGSRIRKTRNAKTPNGIRFESFFCCPYVHPTVMWRKSDFEKLNLYYEKLNGEDYELWTRTVFKLKGFNLQKYLLNYRIDGNNKTLHDKDKPEIEIQSKLYKRNSIPYDINGSFFSDSPGEMELQKRERIFNQVCGLFEEYREIKKQVIRFSARLYANYGYVMPFRMHRKIEYINKLTLFEKMEFDMLFIVEVLSRRLAVTVKKLFRLKG